MRSLISNICSPFVWSRYVFIIFTLTYLSCYNSSCSTLYIYVFMHLADPLLQSNLHRLHSLHTKQCRNVPVLVCTVLYTSLRFLLIWSCDLPRHNSALPAMCATVRMASVWWLVAEFMRTHSTNVGEKTALRLDFVFAKQRQPPCSTSAQTSC